jgi:hypothetical protein
MGEKFLLTSPEDPMEGIENAVFQETVSCVTCAKCAEEITLDFPKDTVFLSCKLMIALTIHAKSALPAQLKIWKCFQ